MLHISVEKHWLDTVQQPPKVESRTQGSRPRPRTQKNPRPRPRTKDTSAIALQKKKKSSSQKFFRRSPKKKKKKGLRKNFSSALRKKTFSKKFFKRFTKFLTIQKILLSSSRGQANF